MGMTRTISHTVVHKESDVMLMTSSNPVKTSSHHSADTTKTTLSVVSCKSPTDSASGLSAIWPTIRMVNSASCNQPVKSPVPTHGTPNSPACGSPTNSKQLDTNFTLCTTSQPSQQFEKNNHTILHELIIPSSFVY